MRGTGKPRVAMRGGRGTRVSGLRRSDSLRPRLRLSPSALKYVGRGRASRWKFKTQNLKRGTPDLRLNHNSTFTARGGPAEFAVVVAVMVSRRRAISSPGGSCSVRKLAAASGGSRRQAAKQSLAFASHRANSSGAGHWCKCTWLPRHGLIPQPVKQGGAGMSPSGALMEPAHQAPRQAARKFPPQISSLRHDSAGKGMPGSGPVLRQEPHRPRFPPRI